MPVNHDSASYVRFQLRAKLAAIRARGQRLRRPGRILHPDTATREYGRHLVALVNDLERLTRERVVAHLPELALLAQHGKPKAVRDDMATIHDAWTDLFTHDFNWVRLEFGQAHTPAALKRMARMAGESVSVFNARQVAGSIGRVVEIDVVANEPWLQTKLGEFVVQNTNLITSLEDTAMSQVQTMAMQGLTQGRRWEDIADDMHGRFDVARSRADLIARDQVGKLNCQLTELRQQDLGITQYIWRGVGDARERETHRENNDQTFSWDDPPAETGHPGEDVLCRCYAEPVIESIDTDS